MEEEERVVTARNGERSKRDVEVGEAIDFLEYYAREALRYDRPPPLTPVPGEENALRYIPLGVRAANSSLRQIDPSLEESAQILGASWLGGFTLPFGVLIYLFELGLVATLQAFIFATLSAIYLGGAVSHH